MAINTGFEIQSFKVHATSVGRLLRRVAPRLERERVLEVLSTGAGAVLRKSASHPG